MTEGEGKRLAALERRWRMVAVIEGGLVLTVVASLAGGVGGTHVRAQDNKLTVSELTIVDGKGTVRVRVGADLPDAVVSGKPVPRGQHAAGVLLYDDTGAERSGYVTFASSRNVALTLDNARTQTALFAAGPEGGSALRLWYGGNSVELRVEKDGPVIHATENRRAAFHEPPVRNPEKTELCEELRKARGKVPDAELFDVCEDRSSNAACRACLGPK